MCAAVFRASTLACNQEPQLGTWPDGAASAELSSRAWPRSPTTMGKRKKPWIPPPPLDLSGIDLEALGPGTDVIIKGGAHRRIQGLRGFILPSTEEHSTSFNVKLCQGPAPLQAKIWCVDRSHVERCDPAPTGDDDGLHPSLRWRLRPPPLTVYSARFVLGWQSLDSLVPPKPEKRAEHQGPVVDTQPAMRLWRGVRRVSSEGVLLPQPKAGQWKPTPLPKIQRDFLSRVPRIRSKHPVEPDTPPPGWSETTEHISMEAQSTPDTVRTQNAVRCSVNRPGGHSAHGAMTDDDMEEIRVEAESIRPQPPWAKPKPKKRPDPLPSRLASERDSAPVSSEKATWPLDTSWPPAPADPAQPLPRSANLDKPFAAILQLKSDKGHQTEDAAEPSQPSPATPKTSLARETKPPEPLGPRRSKSIWFDTTAPSEMAAALRPKRKASRRQMFQTVLLISAANRAADAQQNAADTVPGRRSRQEYKRACTDSLLWPHLRASLSSLSYLCAPLWPRSVTSMRSSPGQALRRRQVQYLAREGSFDSPFQHRLYGQRPGAFHAPAVPYSDGPPSDDAVQIVSSGRGRSKPMTLANKLVFWQVELPAPHQSLQDPRLYSSGLASPPRTATSIPVGCRYQLLAYLRQSQLLPSGLSSTLATGRATLDTAQCGSYFQCPQGWVDCYQDPPNCAVCHQLAPQTASSNLALSEGWTWWLGCLDHPPMILGFEFAQATVSFQNPCLCCCILGTDQDLLEPPASSHLMRELPKATVVIADPFRSGCLSTVPDSGVSQTLAAGHRGHSSPPKSVATSANVTPWLLRLVLGPSSPTTWATHDARAAVDIMNEGPERPRESLSSSLLDFTLATKCPNNLAGLLHWIWIVWTEAVPPNYLSDLFVTPSPCAKPGHGTGNLSSSQDVTMKTHHHQLYMSHPGPNAGGRPTQCVLLRLSDQSTGVRVTSDCPSLVGPKVPTSGPDGKPRQEQNDLTLAETATDGSPPHWPSSGSTYSPDHVATTLQDWPWPQNWLSPEHRQSLEAATLTQLPHWAHPRCCRYSGSRGDRLLDDRSYQPVCQLGSPSCGLRL